MRRVILFIISIFIISDNFGQDSKIIIGIDGGSVLTSLIPRGNNIFVFTILENSKLDFGMQYLSLQSNINYTADLSVEYLITSDFSIKSDLGFEKISAFQNEDYYISNGNYMPSKFTFNYNYLMIPLLAKLSSSGKIKFYVNIGPYIGFLTKHDIIQSSISINFQKQTYNTNNAYNDLGFLFGLGFYIPINNKLDIDLQIRDSYGLKNINNANYLEGKIYTKTLGTLFGLRYKI